MADRVPLKNAKHVIVEGKVRLHVPRRVARVVSEASPEDVTQHMLVEARRLRDAMCTGWETTEAPPMAGIWEVTDHKTGTVREMWWWGGAMWVTGPSPTAQGQDVRHLTHETFAHLYAWRGLKQAARLPYECPPYTLATVPKGCSLGTAQVQGLSQYPEPAFGAN